MPEAPAHAVKDDLLSQLNGEGLPPLIDPAPDAAPSRADQLTVEDPRPLSPVQRADASHATKVGGKGWKVVVRGEYFAENPSGKGKIAKPTEFGKLVTIQEAEHQIVTAFEVHAKRPADAHLWTPALDRHHDIFGRAPDLATGDKGFSSAANERAAEQRGVRRIVLPARGRKSAARRTH